MNTSELMKMTLNELTVEQFIAVILGVLIAVVFTVIIFFALFGIFKILVDFVFYLVCKDKRLGGWFFKRDFCQYIGSLKRQTTQAPTEKAYYLYYNRLVGAVEAFLKFGLINNNLALKFIAVPSYEDLNSKESK